MYNPAQKAWALFNRGQTARLRISQKLQQLRVNGNGLYEGKQYSLLDENKNLKTGGNT
jgi:hypothetical protein